MKLENFVLGALFVICIGCIGALLFYGQTLNEISECQNWQHEAGEYTGFYLTQWQHEECDAHNIKINALVMYNN